MLFGRVLIAYFLFIIPITNFAQENLQHELSSSVKDEIWIRPSQDKEAAKPVWGFVDGIQIGLSPMGGPRGLIRIYTPYLEQDKFDVMNFLALEPIVKGDSLRGLSELENSKLDKKPGKRFWSANDSLATDPRDENAPVQGKIETSNGKETLTLFVFSEKFDNGSQVYVRLRFYEDEPHQIEIKTYATPESSELENFIVTATMGNYARLRNLFLHDKKLSSLDLWPAYKDLHFTDHIPIPIDQFMYDTKKQAYFISAPDEEQPEEAVYNKNTAGHWKYKGKNATQYWRISKYDNDWEGLVNGRYVYWGSEAPIPGGIAFENFEIKAPFKQGNTFIFGISPMKATQFIDSIKNSTP